PFASTRTTWRRLSRTPRCSRTNQPHRGPPGPRGQARPGSRTWTRTVCSKHGGSKVCLLTRQVDVVLRHPGRRVAHQLRQGLEVHAVEDRPRAEAVPQAVELRVLGDAGCLPRTLEALGEADAVPGGFPVGEEDVGARLVQPLEEDEEL